MRRREVDEHYCGKHTGLKMGDPVNITKKQKQDQNSICRKYVGIPCGNNSNCQRQGTDGYIASLTFVWEALRSIFRLEKLLSPPSKVMLESHLSNFLDIRRFQHYFSSAAVLTKARLGRCCSDGDNILSNTPAQ